MDKKSKVKIIGSPREWKGEKGTVYYWPIEFENGDKGDFSTKENPQSKFAVGKEEDYTIEEVEKNGRKNIKIDRPKYDGGGKGGYRPDPKFEKVKNHLIIRQNALTNAVAWANAKNIGLDESKKLTSDQTTQLAQKFYEWTIGPFKADL